MTGRFINADGQLNEDSVHGYNLFAYCENNPVNRSDSTGQFFGLDDLIAGFVGAVVGVVSQFVSDVVTTVATGELHLSNWQTYVGAAAGGAIGGVTTLYAGPGVGNAVGAGCSTFIGQTIEKYTRGTDRSFGEIIRNSTIDAAIAGTVSYVAPVKCDRITSGRNSMQAVYKSGLTKIGNKTASRMSAKVIAKGVVSGVTSNFSLSYTTDIIGCYGVKYGRRNNIDAITGACYLCAA